MGVWWLAVTHVVLTSASSSSTSPTSSPTASPSSPTPSPTPSPSLYPSPAPSLSPTLVPTKAPTLMPTLAPTSSPTYKSYPCLTETLVTKMIRNISAYITNFTNFEDRAHLLGGIVRLTFHDAGTYSQFDGSGGPDGCVDMTDIDNRGLQRVIDALEPLYQQYSNRISRADFWHLAGVTAVAVSKGPTIPWRYGRHDCPGRAAPSTDHGRLPNSQMGWSHVMEVFVTRMGFTARDVVALLGAHTLGRLTAQNSGMDGRWELGQSPAVFDNQFFLSLLTVDWHKVANSYPQHGFPSTHQWNQLSVPTVYPEQMFLSTDIALVVSNANESGCKRAMFTNEQSVDTGCLKNSHTFSIVTEFAHSQDAFFQAFIPAYQKMQELGYSEGTLIAPGQCFTGAAVVDDGTLAPTRAPFTPTLAATASLAFPHHIALLALLAIVFFN